LGFGPHHFREKNIINNVSAMLTIIDVAKGKYNVKLPRRIVKSPGSRPRGNPDDTSHPMPTITNPMMIRIRPNA
jgi:hypothetical protein